MTPETLAALGAALSSPWWAAVALGMFMIFHFTWITKRDKSIERRFSAQFDSIIETERLRAAADIESAEAMKGMEDELRHLTALLLQERKDR